MSTRPHQLSESLKSAANDAGFDWCGICPAVEPTGLSRFYQWIEAGYHGEMQYLESRRDAYSHPSGVMDGAQSIVMLAINYAHQAPSPVRAGEGRISRYAWGSVDYHDLIHDKLRLMQKALADRAPDLRTRGVVDTAPLMEREFAVLAGLGWQGKNTLLLNKQGGSWFFLAALLIDEELEYDEPHNTSHCGTCRACLDACPTNAFVAPYILDARRCISYLTIELDGPVPVDLRESMGDWVFGCDVCQDVCPWNNKAATSTVDAFRPLDNLNPLVLCELFHLSNEDFRQRFRKSPLWRPRRRGILRNAAIVLGNQGNPAAVEALTVGLNDAEPFVRGSSAWALGRIGDCELILRARQERELDPMVADEIEQALLNPGYRDGTGE